MRTRVAYLLALVAIASAVAFGAIVGPYWPLDAVSLTVLCLALLYLMLPKFDPFSLLGNVMARRMSLLSGRTPELLRSSFVEPDYRPPTSRIVHYVRISRMSDAKFMSSQAEGPFEKALLRREGWQRLSEAQLADIAHDAIAEAAEVASTAPTLS